MPPDFGELSQPKLQNFYQNRAVRINDRGPFVRGRCIDLSYGAARALGMSGTAKVSVTP